MVCLMCIPPVVWPAWPATVRMRGDESSLWLTSINSGLMLPLATPVAGLAGHCAYAGIRPGLRVVSPAQPPNTRFTCSYQPP